MSSCPAENAPGGGFLWATARAAPAFSSAPDADGEAADRSKIALGRPGGYQPTGHPRRGGF